jgi:hypothetical protein
MTERTRNADDPRQVGKAKRKEEILAARDAADLRVILGQPAGRRVIWRWLEDHGLYETSFDTNALTMARKEGRRSAGLKILAEVHEASTELALLMQHEAKTAAKREEDTEKTIEEAEEQTTTTTEETDV